MTEQVNQAIEREKLAAQRLQAWLTLAGVVATALIGGVAVTTVNSAYQTRQIAVTRAAEDRQRAAAQSAEDARVAIERVRAEAQIRVEEMKALGQFADAAMGDQIARRIRFAEYFSMMTVTADMRDRWNQYHASLMRYALDLDSLETRLFAAQREGNQDLTDDISRQITRLTTYTARIGRMRDDTAGTQVAAARPPQPVVGPAPRECSAATANELAAMTSFHSRFPGSIEWQLTGRGVEVRNGPNEGRPEIVASSNSEQARGFLRSYATELYAAAKEFAVPVELLIAAVIVESGGRPNIRGASPRFAADAEDLFYGGLSGLSLAVLRSSLNDERLTGEDLMTPSTALRGAAAQIRSRRQATGFDPPLVAAVYNAGSIRFQDGAANRWKLFAAPIGTSRYVDGFVGAFNDAIGAVRSADVPEGVPTFAACLG